MLPKQAGDCHTVGGRLQLVAVARTCVSTRFVAESGRWDIRISPTISTSIVHECPLSESGLSLQSHIAP
jgi:hypothetical protein